MCQCASVTQSEHTCKESSDVNDQEFKSTKSLPVLPWPSKYIKELRSRCRHAVVAISTAQGRQEVIKYEVIQLVLMIHRLCQDPAAFSQTCFCLQDSCTDCCIACSLSFTAFLSLKAGRPLAAGTRPVSIVDFVFCNGLYRTGETTPQWKRESQP